MEKKIVVKELTDLELEQVSAGIGGNASKRGDTVNQRGRGNRART